jgi:tRNA G37 N-methylase TrmD
MVYNKHYEDDNNKCYSLQSEISVGNFVLIGGSTLKGY